jgi:TM2 domain-containing membrane protein YozV
MVPGPAAKPKNEWLAIFLSFVFPGLGQYYVGQRRKGRWFIIIAVILALTVLVEIGVILYPLFWLYNMIDAFLTVRRANAGLPPG